MGNVEKTGVTQEREARVICSELHDIELLADSVMPGEKGQNIGKVSGPAGRRVAVHVDSGRQNFAIGKGLEKLSGTSPIGYRDRGHIKVSASRA
jgi:hypothetical protein